MIIISILSTLRKPKAVQTISLILLLGYHGVNVEEFESGDGNDSKKVALDFLAQLPEHRDPTPLCPSHSFGESASNLVRPLFEGLT